MTHIDVINESTVLKDVDIQTMLPALQQQWNQDLRQYWNIEAVTFNLVPRSNTALNSWWLVFLDTSDQADALAYHDLTSAGQPISKVFAKTLADANASISVGTSHELCEMAIDPWINSASQDAKGVFWSTEICDPVEDDLYGYKIDNILVSDFVTPAWFGHQFAQPPYDFEHHVLAPFEVLSGGYAQTFDADIGWQQIFGSKPRAHRIEPLPGSRRERRTRSWKAWERSR